MKKPILLLGSLILSTLNYALPPAISSDIDNPGQTALEIARMAYERSNPIGSIITLAHPNCPAGTLPADGRLLEQTTYQALYQALGQIYGGDNTQFRLPDLRGEFIRGFDNGRGVDADRSFGNRQGDQTSKHKHVINWGESYGEGFGRTNTHNHIGSASTDYDNYHYFTNDGTDYNGFSNNGVIGDETRPKNVALLFCIVAGIVCL